MEELKKIKKLSIIGFFVISILGTLLHFTYEFSGNNIIIGIFSAVNESVFEHIKIAVVPMYIWSIVQIFLINKKNYNFFLAQVVKVVVCSIVLITIFYTYTSFAGEHIRLVDILTFYISIFVAQIFEYNIITKTKRNKKIEIISIILYISILLLIIWFTFNPLKVDIFRDLQSNTYGIFEEKLY